MTELDSTAFSNCSNLETIKVNEKNQVYKSLNCNAILKFVSDDNVSAGGKKVYEFVKGCKNSEYPNPEEYTCIKIGDDAFRGCKEKKDIVITETVTEIGVCAFMECDGITSITIPSSITHISEYAFSSCSGLTSVTIPEQVSTIKKGGFWVLYKSGEC